MYLNEKLLPAPPEQAPEQDGILEQIAKYEALHGPLFAVCEETGRSPKEEINGNA